MQKGTIDSLLRRPNVVGSEHFIGDIKSSQSTPDADSSPQIIYEGELQEDTLTDIDLSSTNPQSECQQDTLEIPDFHEVGEVLPSISLSVPPTFTSTTKLQASMDLSSYLNGNRRPKETNTESDQEIQTINRGNHINDLEKRMFRPERKSVNVKDFLSGSKPAAKSKSVAPDIEVIDEIEAKIFENQRKVTAKDLLSVRSKTPRPSMYVTLNVDKEALAFYKRFENSLKSRGTSVFVRKPKYEVTLKIPGHRLQHFESRIEELQEFHEKKKNVNSVFSMMMRESASAAVRLTPLQKLKELDPPVIKASDFHVFDLAEDNLPLHSDFLAGLKPRRSHFHNIEDSYQFTLENDSTTTQHLEKACPQEDPVFAALHKNPFDFDAVESQNWPQLFEPSSTSALLLPDDTKTRLQIWLHNSFGRLKTQSFKGSRRLKKRKVKKDDEMAGFIVDSPFEYEEETDEEVFMPLLVVHGDTGTGKSASIYAAMKEMNGYIHEINAGQARARKNILGMLKELCTTQLVHEHDQDGDFQKGIVLLEDCDILFEQDRTFWIVVQEILEISRRPMVITCTDPSVIPRALYEYAYEENAVLSFDKGRQALNDTYKKYLWGCCFSRGYDLDSLVIENLITNPGISKNMDVRQALLACQMICHNQIKPNYKGDEMNIIRITLNQTREVKPQVHTLEHIASSLDLLSIADLTETNVASQLNHDTIENEFIDIYYIDESKRLKQALLPHEQRIITELQTKALDAYPTNSDFDSYHTHNAIRRYVNDFVSSRSRPVPPLLRGLQMSREGPRTTRSNNGSERYEFWDPEPVGIPDGSVSLVLSPTPFTLEFAPFARYWCTFQAGLDKCDKQTELRTKMFIQWREFQNKSTRPLRTAPYIKH
ncbi:hypothetical protein PSN45_003037 [Yamadazyma tenuis]|uniref:uncharacterized protein n=1 Tax=Candida tenuis TaxID=2315449 RepID=UPI0027A5741C|nr:hypothetical protein PSN45_003037 [Yamadazyma tenuis]